MTWREQLHILVLAAIGLAVVIGAVASGGHEPTPMSTLEAHRVVYSGLAERAIETGRDVRWRAFGTAWLTDPPNVPPDVLESMQRVGIGQIEYRSMADVVMFGERDWMGRQRADLAFVPDFLDRPLSEQGGWRDLGDGWYANLSNAP